MTEIAFYKAGCSICPFLEAEVCCWNGSNLDLMEQCPFKVEEEFKQLEKWFTWVKAVEERERSTGRKL